MRSNAAYLSKLWDSNHFFHFLQLRILFQFHEVERRQDGDCDSVHADAHDRASNAFRLGSAKTPDQETELQFRTLSISLEGLLRVAFSYHKSPSSKSCPRVGVVLRSSART